MTNTEVLDKILSEITEFNDITIEDIPIIDLYMDQVTTLFENKLNPLKRNEEDKILTKTMINNYAKAKIFPPVKSKKYNKDQIILLSLIYNLKQSLSLSDIGTVFNSFVAKNEENEKNTYNIEDMYDKFLKMKQQELKNFSQEFNELFQSIEKNSKGLSTEKSSKSELILLIFMLIVKANINIRMAEKVVDNFFKEEAKK